jgi:hypothetical protein
MEQIKESVTKLEWRVDGHENEITLLKETSRDFKKTLDLITLTLKQIKWLAMGGCAVYFATELGLMGILRVVAL